MRVPLASLLSAIAICGAVLAAPTAGRIDARSVWSGGADLSACRPVPDDARQRACLARVMRANGASPQAIAFTRAWRDLAYVSKFRAFGPVDLAVATSPFMANSNDSFLLVNGHPRIIDVAAQANDRALSRRQVYRTFKQAHPDADLWPLDGDFGGMTRGPGGGQRFVFSMPFKTCHACAIVATTRLAYDFDRAGGYRGMTLLGVTPGP